MLDLSQLEKSGLLTSNYFYYLEAFISSYTNAVNLTLVNPFEHVESFENPIQLDAGLNINDKGKFPWINEETGL